MKKLSRPFALPLETDSIDQARQEFVDLVMGELATSHFFKEEYSSDSNNVSIIRRHLLAIPGVKEAWDSQIDKFLENDEFTLYHVCATPYEHSLLELGIYHDASPTLSASLVGSLASAQRYELNRRHSTILKYRLPKNAVFYRYIDFNGPGFLPIERKTRVELPFDLPSPILVDISNSLNSSRLRFAYWLDPKYRSEVIHRTSEATLESLDALINQWRVSVTQEV
ncbi:hypothetical protein J4401_01910 [Candidatus Woesearchaeota archaeon]|nr:hypothetical protein [Candidatus Woesearchaeota archaeon]